MTEEGFKKGVDDELSGGMRAVSEIGTHWIDLAYAWTGLKITEVSAALANWYPVRYLRDGMLTDDVSGEPVSINTEDSAAVLMKFENGAIGTLLLSETAPGHPNDLSIEVSNLKASYRWEEAAPDVLSVSDSDEMKPALFPVPDRTESFVNLFREVYGAVEASSDGRDASALSLNYPTFEDGAYLSAVCSAIKESAESKSWISVE